MDVDAEELTQAAASQPSEMVNGHAEDDFHKTDKSKSKLSLKYSEYKSMATQLVITIRRSEERAEGGESGVRRSDIVNQYLKDIESEIETEEELAERKLLVDKVLDRLITHDHVILALKEWGETEDVYTPSEEDDPFLVVHPNFVIE